MADVVYVKGFRTFAKNEKAPDFVLGSLVITVDELMEWLCNDAKQYYTQYNGKDQIKLQIKQGKDGRVNFNVDTYKKEPF